MGFDLITPTHILFLAILGLVLFGPKRLPDMGRSLGMGIREFKSSVTNADGIAGTVTRTDEGASAPLPVPSVDESAS